ncbi:hypothetical protein [Hymenobacter algoricola]|uniref:hypothetical protein n=1 Tax=Hymenobacter algoricola TaxID=486267 RepID=UPI0031F04313
MKKITALLALVCLTSLSAQANIVSRSSNPAMAKKASAAVVLPAPQVCYQYSMCGHSGNACGEGIDGCLEILNMLSDMYCG